MSRWAILVVSEECYNAVERTWNFCCTLCSDEVEVGFPYESIEAVFSWGGAQVCSWQNRTEVSKVFSCKMRLVWRRFAAKSSSTKEDASPSIFYLTSRTRLKRRAAATSGRRRVASLAATVLKIRSFRPAHHRRAQVLNHQVTA